MTILPSSLALALALAILIPLWLHGRPKRAQKAAQSAKESPETKQAVKWAAEETKGLQEALEKYQNRGSDA